MPKAFRFGIVCSKLESGSQWLEHVQEAQALGYDRLLAPDTFSPDRPAPFPALTAAALSTSLDVGTYVCCTDYHHPVVLAKIAATLDTLTPGRFLLGLGPGNWKNNDYEKAGIHFDPVGTRVSRFEEAVHIIKSLLTAETVNFQGKYFTISDMKGFLHPQQAAPRVYIGAGGPRMLKIAGRVADIIGIAPLPQSQQGYGPFTGATDLENATDEPTLQKIAWVREAAGERFANIELACPVFRVAVTDRQEQAIEQSATYLKLSPEQVRQALPILIGTTEQIAELLWERRERYGISYIIVLDKDRHAFAPVIALLKDRDKVHV